MNPLFCPKLQCDVFDYVYKGLVQPLLGTFTISIGDIMHKENTKRELYLKESENLMIMLNDKKAQLEQGIMGEEQKQLGIEEEIKEDLQGVIQGIDFDKRA